LIGASNTGLLGSLVMITNHVHLLISVDRLDASGLLMKALGQRYVLC
jgi:hypothetical protein